jgi:hypothetical protein
MFSVFFYKMSNYHFDKTATPYRRFSGPGWGAFEKKPPVRSWAFTERTVFSMNDSKSLVIDRRDSLRIVVFVLRQIK